MRIDKEEGAVTMQQIFRLALCLSLVVPSATAAGQGFPVKPVRIIVPFPPGAGPDIVARAVGQKLAEHWKHQIVVDNRPGGGGNIATELAARAIPDGYTLLLASNHFTINPSLFSKVPYDPVRDFVPVTLAAATPNILVVHPSLPVKSVRDLIALAKAKPDQHNFSWEATDVVYGGRARRGAGAYLYKGPYAYRLREAAFDCRAFAAVNRRLRARAH